MTTSNQGLAEELGHVANASERGHIEGLFQGTDPLMHQIAYDLIVGHNHEVDRLTREALESGFSANTILDDGLIAGMAIVGIKFRDNIIFVPEVLVAARAMKAGMVHLEPILSASGIRTRRHCGHGDRQGRPSRHRQEPLHHDAAGIGLHRSRLWAWTPSRRNL